MPLSSLWRLILAAPALASAFMAIMPVLQIPNTLDRSSRNFEAAFAHEPLAIEDAVSRKAGYGSPFNPAWLYLWPPTQEAFLESDILYLEETGKDGITRRFHFDRWLPAAQDGAGAQNRAGTAGRSTVRRAAPGPFPVVIRIHGGAWVSGDKGAGNVNAMNRRLASRGYAVFDVQYGLNNRSRFGPGSDLFNERRGSYELDDMLRHLSVFSRHLADNAAALDADLSRVFIAGSSAGGHLAILLGLSQGRENAPDGEAVLPGHLDSRLALRGVIPWYPALGLAHDMGIEGSAALNDPSLLLEAESPPMLVYQGFLDGMVPWRTSQTLFERFNELWTDSGNTATASTSQASGSDSLPASGSKTQAPISVVWFPLAGHGNDIIYSGPSSQVFAWYVDRFLDLYSSN